MADFSLLQPSNPLQSLAAGYQAGQALGKQRALDQAYQGIDLERPETLLPVLRADPSTGAALIGASVKLSSEARALKQQTALAGIIKGALSGSGSGGGSSAASGASSTTASPASPATAPVSDATPSAPGEITVTARQPAPVQPSLGETVGNFVGAGGSLDQAKDLVSLIGSATKAQQDKWADAANAQATIGQQALGMPYAQRKAFIQAQSGFLLQHGVTADQIAGFDPTDDNLHTQVGQAIGVKGIIEQQGKDRSFQLDKDKFGHQVAHDDATLAVSQANLGVARGNLAVSQHREAREAGKAPGGSAPVTRTIGGKTYYQVNGKWYDNADGR